MSLTASTDFARTDGWSADIAGRIRVSDDTDSPLFNQMAEKHNNRIDAPLIAEIAEKEVFDRIVAGTKMNVIENRRSTAVVVPMHSEKSPGGFLSRMFSKIKQFFKEI